VVRIVGLAFRRLRNALTVARDTFTPQHRGGRASPLVCLHGFTDTWRTWELVLPALERRHDVLAPTLPGHAGGLALPAAPGAADLVDAVEAAMDEAGFAAAHLVGNSLGGYLAFRLAERGRARSIVAFAPAGGWPPDDPAFREMLEQFVTMRAMVAAAAPHAEAILSTPEGRRQATRFITTNVEHLPVALLAHLIRGAAACDVRPLVDAALRDGYTIDAERIRCPVRIVWGTADLLLPYPQAAERYRTEWAPQADWVLLGDVGHCPQLDVPLEAAELILGFNG
jgi:pimeloyl-ACP methyl ester carboxylesterase